MKKSLLFVINGYNSGGVCKAFLPFVQQIDYSKYDIYIHPTADYKIWRRVLPKYIHIVDTSSMFNKRAIFPLRLITFFHRICIRLSKNYTMKDYFAIKRWILPKKIYDHVICYNAQDMAAITLASRYKALQRTLWFHGAASDLEKISIKLCKKQLKKYSSFVAVSQSLANDIISVYPQLKNKISVIHNTVDIQAIEKMSQEPISVSFQSPSIVTVGRICREKGQLLIPATVKKLLDNGYIVNWYIIGDGNMRDDVIDEINKYDVGEHVTLLGNQENPFPFIKNCDIYVQTSLSEGWGLTVQEARILCKPIIVTPLPVMYEQINSRHNGLISNECTAAQLYKSIKECLDSPELCDSFSQTLKKELSYTTTDMQKFYDLIET